MVDALAVSKAVSKAASKVVWMVVWKAELSVVPMVEMKGIWKAASKVLQTAV